MQLRALISTVAGPVQHSDNRKSVLARAARAAGLSFRSIKSVWYGEIDDPDHPTIRLLKHAAEQRAKAAADGRAEIVKNFKRLLAMRDALIAQDPEFNKSQTDALEYALGMLVGDVGAREI